MDAKKLAVGSLIGAVVFNLTGFTFWELLMGDFFAAHLGSASGVEREAPIIWSVLLSTVFLGALMTTLLGWSGSKSAVDGLKTGALVGVLVTAGYDFLFYGFTNLMDMTATLTDIGLGTVQWALVGLCIAAAVGMMGERAAT